MARCQLTTHANVCLQHLMAPRISQARDFGRVSISISHFCRRLNCCSSLTFVTRIDFYVFLLPCACLHATFGQFHPARSRLGSCQLIAKGAASPMRIRECVSPTGFLWSCILWQSYDILAVRISKRSPSGCSTLWFA